MEKYTIYVLKSQKNGKQYVGFTSKGLKTRIDWHRWGLTAWTKHNGPFELLYFEERDSKVEALRREKYFKTGQGRRMIENLKNRVRSSVPATMRGGRAMVCGAG